MIVKSAPEYSVIGSSPIRSDGYDKVTGRAIYGSDVKIPGTIWGEILRSKHAHARILSINTAAAEKLPGVFSVITGNDFPDIGPKPIDMASDDVPAEYASQNIMATKKAMYVGHAIAAVAAVDKDTALHAISLIDVEYEQLKAVFDVDSAVAPDAPLLIESHVADHVGEEVTGTNIAWHFRYEHGDPDENFAKSSLIVERTFKSSTVHQGYVEPHIATALWDESNRIQLWTSTQGNFGVRRQTAGLLGLDESSIIVHPVEVGGGFGGKTVVYLTPIAALLSKKSGRPVKMVMDRKSVFEATGPAPGGEISVKIGVGDELEILAATASIRLEAGAFPGWVAETASKSIFSCYDVANTRVDGYDILVNKPKSNAYRAPGVPQVTFAVESIIDEICDTKGWDSLEFRKANASKEGTRRLDGPRLQKIGVQETLEAVGQTDHWNSPLGEARNGLLRGRGFACSFALFSGRSSTVSLHLNGDGTVSMVEGSVDIAGTRTTLGMLVAEVLGISVEDILGSVAHTDAIGFTEVSHGSRTTYATGGAAHDAAQKLVVTMRARAALLWDVDSESVRFDHGCFSSSGPDGQQLNFKELAILLTTIGEPVNVTASVDPPSPAQGVCASHIVDLEVDPTTGKVDILRYTAVQDVGRAIHRAQVEGQIQGAAVQGIGWALSEEYLWDENGQMRNHNYQDYRMQTAVDLPFIDPVIVEVANPDHPFGVRGAGEISIGPPTGAIANAIFDATGVRMSELPMKPGRILEALEGLDEK